MKTLITVAAVAFGLTVPAFAQDAKPAASQPVPAAAKPAETPKAQPAAKDAAKTDVKTDAKGAAPATQQ